MLRRFDVGLLAIHCYKFIMCLSFVNLLGLCIISNVPHTPGLYCKVLWQTEQYGILCRKWAPVVHVNIYNLHD